MELLEKINLYLNKGLLWIAGILLGCMILLTCSNIFLRAFWVPIKGTYELMGYMGAVVMGFALGYTQLSRGHTAVDILVLRFSKRMRRVLDGINNLICAIFFALITWRIVVYATTLWSTGEVTETLRIVYFPFTYCVALGAGAATLEFAVGFLKSILEKEQIK